MSEQTTLRLTDYIIDETTATSEVFPNTYGRGLIPRDYSVYPTENYDSLTAFTMPLIPRDEIIERIKEKAANKSQLSDIRRRSGPDGSPIPAYQQGEVGYCWNHSLIGCMVLSRAATGQPYVRLSPFMVGCLIKDYKDEGGWGALALEFVMKHGVPDVKFWPERSMDRKNDTPEMRANAARYKITEAFQDLSVSVYDRNLTEDQALTCLLLNIPVIGDFNWWRHSVCLMDAVLIKESQTKLTNLDLNNPKDRAEFNAIIGKRGLNSWGNEYGDLGEFVLQGYRATLSGGAAPAVPTLAA